MALILTLSLTACGGTDKPAPTPSAPFEPKAALAEATAVITEGTYKFEIFPIGPSVRGSIHAPTRSAELETTVVRPDHTARTRVLFVGAKSFANIGLSGARYDEIATALPKLKKDRNPVVRKRVKLLEEMYETLSGRYWMPYDPDQVMLPAVEVGTPDALGVKAILDSATGVTGTPEQINGLVAADDIFMADHVIGRLSFPVAKSAAGTKVPITVTLRPDRTISDLMLSYPGGGWRVRLDPLKSTAVVAPPASSLRKPSAGMMDYYHNGGIF
jgi:hypothetical protein